MMFVRMLNHTCRFLNLPFLRRMSSSPGVRLIPTIVSPSNHAEVSACIKTLAAAFRTVPCTFAFSLESTRGTTEDPVSAYVDRTIRKSLRSGAALVQSGETSAVSLWELPHFDKKCAPHTEESEDDTSVGPIKREWGDIIHRAKAKYIGVAQSASNMSTTQEHPTIMPHYHLDFLGRNPHVTKILGAVSAVVVSFLEQARQERLKVWLEATSPEVIPLYEHFGFKMLEEITVGSGSVDNQGRAQEGGPGVKAWLMLIDNSVQA
ncbi:uncharacterized protein BCR38DRAFT_415743 [Pseudomassariella vexata]|uniref:N-acetyltransferase domain-containing protein n=1 Tax=Pseudomassariella vexata TaxID=1141098 RepID=A0A1Y2EIA6_9PEZI|nr:uncharacterized protein BCR38DRAFT_415743 [Pseudomassariella vexata]ORY71034.1 hypothetical protein BCR38DRAFT_415743 [Pseudomassariella vexata]